MIHIRPATLSDAPQLAAIHVQGWHESYTGLMPQSLIDEQNIPARTDGWTQIMAKPGVRVNYAEGLGFCCIGPARDPVLSDYPQEVYSLYILKSGQGRGLGKRLLRETLSPGTFYLWTLGLNTKARAFYEHLGGQHIATRIEQIEGADFDDVAYGFTGLDGTGLDGTNTSQSGHRHI